MDVMAYVMKEELLGLESTEDRHIGPAQVEGARTSVDSEAAAVAAWLEEHRDEMFECHRHNGLARLTIKACAERYRLAINGWLDSLRLQKNHPLRLSFATCAACPLGLYHARSEPKTWAGIEQLEVAERLAMALD